MMMKKVKCTCKRTPTVFKRVRERERERHTHINDPPMGVGHSTIRPFRLKCIKRSTKDPTSRSGEKKKRWRRLEEVEEEEEKAKLDGY